MASLRSTVTTPRRITTAAATAWCAWLSIGGGAWYTFGILGILHSLEAEVASKSFRKHTNMNVYVQVASDLCGRCGVTKELGASPEVLAQCGLVTYSIMIVKHLDGFERVYVCVEARSGRAIARCSILELIDPVTRLQ